MSGPVQGTREHDAGTQAPGETRRQAIGILGGPGDADLHEVVDLARSICGADAAAITIILDGDCHHLATVGVGPLVGAAHDTLVALRVSASAPIHAEGDVVGRLCVYGAGATKLSPAQEQALLTLAWGIARIIELRLHQLRSHEEPETGHADGTASISEEGLQVAAQIGHDIRNPLTTIMASLEMLHESAPADEDPQRARLLASARRATSRLATMVEGVLRLNRLGQQQLQLNDVRLADVARQVVEDARPALDGVGAVVHLGTMPEVRADQGQMYSVLSNLVNNAVKFARPGVPPVIDIRARRCEQGWRISVADNGVGIPEEMREKVFGMFARLDPAVEGSGIGLATVQRIVESHGGRVGVEETRGRGTEIWFELAEQHPGRPVTP